MMIPPIPIDVQDEGNLDRFKSGDIDDIQLQKFADDRLYRDAWEAGSSYDELLEKRRRCLEDPQKLRVYRRHYGEETYLRLAWKWHQSQNIYDISRQIFDREDKRPKHERLFVLTLEEFLDKRTKRTFAYVNGLPATLKPLVLAKYNRSIRDNYADIIKWLRCKGLDPNFREIINPDHFMVTGIYLMLRDSQPHSLAASKRKRLPLGSVSPISSVSIDQHRKNESNESKKGKKKG